MPDYAAIKAAASRTRALIRRTPLLGSDLLNDQLGFELLVKAEPLQRTGSFKFRGASNALLSLPDDGQPVIAWSSGNHAQAVALAARLTGRQAYIVMPEDAPELKRANTAAYRANVILYDRYSQSREEIGTALQAEQGGHIIQPYENAAVIAGQGTAGLEIAEDLQAAATVPDYALVCCGGGGLLAGVSLALKQHFGQLAIYAAEPEGFDDTARSLAAGQILSNDPAARSICDAIVTPCPGQISFAINSQLVSGGKVVSDAAVLSAMRLALDRFKLVIEPGGAVALAAALDPDFRREAQGKRVVVIASGGNLDGEMLDQARAAPLPDGL